MRYRPLGRTGQFVSEICLGTMTSAAARGFWQAIGQLDQAASTALVGRALEAGVNFIDTANVYSEGSRSAARAGAARPRREARGRDRRHQGARPHGAGAERGRPVARPHPRPGRREPQAPRPRARRPLPDPRLRSRDPARGDAARARQLRRARPRAHDRLLEHGRLADHEGARDLGQAGLARFETVQAYYSIAGRELEREILPLVEDQGLGVMVWSPLAGGFLSGKFTREKRGDNDSRRTTFDFPPVDKERAYDIIDAMEPVAKAHDVVGRAGGARLAPAAQGRDERHHRRQDRRAARRQSRRGRADADGRRDRGARRGQRARSPNIPAGCWRARPRAACPGRRRKRSRPAGGKGACAR